MRHSRGWRHDLAHVLVWQMAFECKWYREADGREEEEVRIAETRGFSYVVSKDDVGHRLKVVSMGGVRLGPVAFACALAPACLSPACLCVLPAS